MQYRTLFIGADGERTVNGAETRRQIAAVTALACRLMDPDGSRALTWLDFDNPQEPRTLFPSILADREQRVDQKRLMADRPAFAVITAAFSDDPGGTGQAVRLEYYEGHDALQLVFDIRAPELAGKDLPRFLQSDPHAYDPAKFLAETFGLPEELTRPLLEEAHRQLEEGKAAGAEDAPPVAQDGPGTRPDGQDGP